MPNFYSPDGNYEVWDEKPTGYYTKEEWDALHPAPPPPEPTKEEKLAQLDAQYEQDKKELLNEYNDAMIHDDNATAEAVKAEMLALDDQYDEDYQAIIDGEA